ncbi:ABC transporter family protein 57 [Achromobacter xylosoxidans A8]|uniref:ABC transporter family protein 57 n=1 Tax=Achromobacter xylosoxidans (strain A8) TaxID=762376 RepID=E3HJ62_ACHXA|nr:ABC transporter ATP-binding protein [Achromobacter xylosoxidans]ADP16804.1 ABC transporter family protein 57 [Achromobacter xylosoxidans A8]
MAQIELDLSHSYVADPKTDEDYALLPLAFTFRDGGAYALLGPSGCGKTTLLNCVSGLLRPSHGRILFDGQDVTDKTPQARNIAQVFQFPVVYDTMTVAENLAFPLRNRGMAPKLIRERVGRIAEMLEMSNVLDRRASGLTADAKQKISLGRGLVRSDVSAILFDEPLTVIDPQLKWELRRKLKEIHHEFKLTLIYVTHDQTEALTFADEVMVMARGRAVQVGSADDLFQRPAHTFVGHFIGSPGMNFLPAQWRDGGLEVGKSRVVGVPAEMAAKLDGAGPVKLGVRPEYLRITEPGAPGAVAMRVERVQDVGTYTLLVADFEGTPVRARLGSNIVPAAAGGTVWLSVVNPHTCFYRNEELIR